MTRTRSVRRVVVRYVLLILFALNAKAGQLIFANYICGINILCIPSVCSDRILTCRIKSIRSPAKVGLVVIDLITSPVVSWEGWETPPPSTEAQLSFFAQPPAWEDLSLLW